VESRSLLNITHPLHDYGPINEILELEPLSERRYKLSINFTTKLLEGLIDALRLLEQLCIRVPGNTRSQDNFYPPYAKRIVLKIPKS